MKTYQIALSLLATPLVGYAFLSPPAAPLGSPIEYTEELTTTGAGSETTFYAFDQFDSSLGTLDSIQFGVRIDAAPSTTSIDSDGQMDALVVGGDIYSWLGAWPCQDDFLGDGSNYNGITARVGAAPAGNKITRKNYHPLYQVIERGEDDTVAVSLEDPDDWFWSGEYTDATLLSQFTGSDTKRVYYDLTYANMYSGSWDSGSVVPSVSGYTAYGGVRYNYTP